MITKCDWRDKERIFSYIGNDYPSCLYLYLDLIRYGFDYGTINAYIQGSGDDIESVLLSYYSCLHVYSKDDAIDAVELGLFFMKHNFRMLYCTAELAKKVFNALPQPLAERATITFGWVAQIRAVDKLPAGMAIPASTDDYVQITKLINEDDDIGKSYNYEELAKQLEERNREGYARNIVIKQGDMVIAHACTNAELDTIAVVAELVVRQDYRRRGFASEIWRDICNQLLEEGKEVFSFYYSEESRMLHNKIGFSEVCEWAKVVIG